jgi:hypothetical protein
LSAHFLIDFAVSMRVSVGNEKIMLRRGAKDGIQ